MMNVEDYTSLQGIESGRFTEIIIMDAISKCNTVNGDCTNA